MVQICLLNDHCDDGFERLPPQAQRSKNRMPGQSETSTWEQTRSAHIKARFERIESRTLELAKARLARLKAIRLARTRAKTVEREEPPLTREERRAKLALLRREAGVLMAQYRQLSTE